MGTLEYLDNEACRTEDLNLPDYNYSDKEREGAMLKAVIGVSDDVDVEVALRTVIDSCRDQLENQAPQVGILFTGKDLSALERSRPR